MKNTYQKSNLRKGFGFGSLFEEMQCIIQGSKNSEKVKSGSHPIESKRDKAAAQDSFLFTFLFIFRPQFTSEGLLSSGHPL